MNFENWTGGEPQYLAKIKVFKADYSIIFGAKIEFCVTKCVEKTLIYIFSTFGSKINKFEWKKLEKITLIANSH